MAAYLLVDLDIQDQDGFQEYRSRVPEYIAKYGGEYLVRGGEFEVIEGDWTSNRLVVFRFPIGRRSVISLLIGRPGRFAIGFSENPRIVVTHVFDKTRVVKRCELPIVVNVVGWGAQLVGNFENVLTGQFLGQFRALFSGSIRPLPVNLQSRPWSSLLDIVLSE